MSAIISSRRRRPARSSATDVDAQGRDRWLVSYADLVTLLLALFVVLYASADHERAHAVAQSLAAQFVGNDAYGVGNGVAGNGVLPGSNALLTERAAVENTLAQNQSLRERAKVTMTERGVVVSLAEAGFFASGDAEVRDDALPLLDALAQSLQVSEARIRIEGHTDSTPISSARYPSNWELSTARASAVLARLVARGTRPARLSIAGFADERPVASNETPEGRALNRRVDIVILRSNE